ncbi:SDR family oxidoreductase [Leucobacter chironomi]|uniref:SDR family oxidoreductase n=1 Tax=Leucobacter chironomi TaxID=491918 RepID=UPI00040CEC3C|nr:SDR family oxidoreductase [Leucobacter chironomi]
MDTLRPRTAIVTGAARGLGRAIALELARRGAQLALFDLDLDGVTETAQLIRGSGGEAAAFAVDVSDEQSVRDGVAGVAERLGPPLILVNNAGVLRDDLLFKMPVENWDTIMNVHLRGAFLLSREAQQHMVDHGWGRIVNISSTSALGNAGQANYSAAKAGIQGLTKTLALELGRFGITANAVAPGFTVTDMTRSVAERLGIGFDELVAREAAAVPVRRVGTPEDIAHAVAFFADEASGFVSGQVLYVAGGPRG